MFGIKTKKDKRIEELEEQLRYTYFKQPMIIENRGNVLTVASKVRLEDMMPVEYAKEMILQNMAKNLKEYISYDLEEYSNGKKALAGYLKIVVGDVLFNEPTKIIHVEFDALGPGVYEVTVINNGDYVVNKITYLED